MREWAPPSWARRQCAVLRNCAGLWLLPCARVACELRLGVQEWSEVLEAVGGRTGIETVRVLSLEFHWLARWFMLPLLLCVGVQLDMCAGCCRLPAE